MTNHSNSRKPTSPVAKIVPWSNGIVFVMMHFVIVKGFGNVFSSFISTLVGVLLGCAGYAVWRFKPEVAKDARLGPVLGLITILSYNVLRFYAVPPPPPPPMEVTLQDNGTWRLNRGGGQLVGERYIVLPSDEEAATSPKQIGVVYVPDCNGAEFCTVEFEGLRKPFEGRKAYFVRPRRPQEWIPPYRELASLVAMPSQDRGVLDMGSRLEVEAGDLYAIFGDGMKGSHGYLVIDQVEPASASGRLVQLSEVPHLPANLERIGKLSRFVEKQYTNAELANAGGNKENAMKLFQLVFDLTGGTDERARKRLAELKGIDPASVRVSSTSAAAASPVSGGQP